MLYVSAIGLVKLTRGRSARSAIAIAGAHKILLELEEGVCQNCDAVHPEAATHTGVDDFWTSFKCPDCGYTINVHVRHNSDH